MSRRIGLHPRGMASAVALLAAALWHLHGAPATHAQLPAGAGGDGVVVEGRVLADDGSTTPLPGARVSVVSDGPAGSATPAAVSDRDGRFTVGGPARGGVSLRVTKAGFAAADVPVDTRAEPVIIRLAPGAVITGRVVDAHGEPVPGVLIQAWPEQCPGACTVPVPLASLAALVRTAVTDDLGEYRIGSLPAGPREIWVGESIAALVAARQSATTVPEPEARVRLGTGDAIALSHVYTTGMPETGAPPLARPDGIDRRGGSIRGHILDATGRPLAGASVSVHDLDTGASRSGHSDSAGRYQLIGLPA